MPLRPNLVGRLIELFVELFDFILGQVAVGLELLFGCLHARFVFFETGLFGFRGLPLFDSLFDVLLLALLAAFDGRLRIPPRAAPAPSSASTASAATTRR